MRSEAATLEFLRNKTGVPVPRIYDVCLGETNPVGVGYILFEKMPGKSLRCSLAATEQKENVMRQLADTFLELRMHPFDAMGSLDTPGTSHIGPFAREETTDYIDSQIKPIGPFKSSYESLRAEIQFTLDLILRGERYATRPIDGFLIHRFLLDSIPKLLSHSKHNLDDGKFYLKHADDKGDHILVDDEYNITAIVDWEWAHTDSAAFAFNSPIMLLPVNEFYDELAMGKMRSSLRRY